MTFVANTIWWAKVTGNEVYEGVKKFLKHDTSPEDINPLKGTLF